MVFALCYRNTSTTAIFGFLERADPFYRASRRSLSWYALRIFQLVMVRGRQE
jgi:hypothetical protein